MSEKEFHKMINPDQTQVFLMSSWVSMRPVSFFLHTWIVTVHKGKIDRWEVWKAPKACRTSWGHVHRNLFKPWEGRPKDEGNPKSALFRSRILGRVEGRLAKKMVNFLRSRSRHYRNAHTYSYVKTNCNTFTQWVIKHFPEAKLNLPFSAWGKWFA